MNEATQQQAPPQESSGTGNHTVVVPPRAGFVHVDRTVYEQGPVADNAIALIVSLALTGLVVTSALTEWHTGSTTPDVADAPAAVVVQEGPVRPLAKNPFESVEVEAYAAVVYDVYTGKVLYAKRAEEVRSLASLTKVMTGLVAYEAAGTDRRVAISPRAIETEGDSGLFAHETWKLGDLLSFMLITSSNDGADAVATAVGGLWDLEEDSTDEYIRTEHFVGAMNRKAQDIGMVNTVFTNATGLDESDTYGGLGSAQDVARLFAYTWEHAPATLTDTTEQAKTYVSDDGFIHAATNTNGYVNSFPRLLGSKTGYTEQAGANLAIIYDAGMNHPVVVVALGSSHDGRFADVSALVQATNAYITNGWYAYEIAGTTPMM